MKMLVFFLIFSLNIFSETTLKPARAYLMGDAYSSIAEGSYSIFYNPALLARNSGLSFHPVPASFIFPNALAKIDDFNSIGSDPAEIFDVVSDFPIRIGYNLAPGFKLGNFGFSAIIDNDSTVKILNEVNPILDINYRDDRGFAIGYAFEVNSKLSFGTSFKYIKRNSIDENYSLTSTTLLDALNGGDLDSILNSLGKVESLGWSVDMGFDYVNKKGATTFMSGIAFKDIYNTIELSDKNSELTPIEQRMMVNISVATMTELAKLVGFTVTAEYKDILNQYKETIDKIHLGGEFSITKALSLLAGYNARAINYGARLNLGLIDFYIGASEERLGERIDQGKASGIVLYLSLLDFKFEP